jgi:hypothetical protein
MKNAFLLALFAAPQAILAASMTFSSPGFSAGGASFNFTGGLSSSSPTWTRPTALNQFRTPTSAFSSGRQYQTQTFTPTTTAAYEVTTNSGTLTAKSTFIYSGNFNAAAPLQNLVVGSAGTGTFGTPVLSAGTTYTIVTTNTNAGTFGSYNITLKQGVTSDDVANIPNGDPNGRIFTINIPDTGVITSFTNIKLHGLRTSEAGGLLVTLTHMETGRTIDVLDRLTGDLFGSPDLHFGSMLGNFGSADYTFVDSGGSAYPGTTSNVVPGTYNIFSGTAGFENSSANGSLASFVGESITGTWQLRISDRESDSATDNTVLSGFSMVFDVSPIPEPACTAALALASAFFVIRRRRY